MIAANDDVSASFAARSKQQEVGAGTVPLTSKNKKGSSIVGQNYKKPRQGTLVSGRNARRIGAAGVLGLFGLAAIAAYAVYSTVPGRIQVAPVSLVVHSAATLPAEVRALETLSLIHI